MALLPYKPLNVNFGKLINQNSQTAAAANGLVTPMGVKAPSPAGNVSKPSNTYAASPQPALGGRSATPAEAQQLVLGNKPTMSVPMAASPSNTTGYSAQNPPSYPGLVSQLSNLAINGDPAVGEANRAYQDFVNRYGRQSSDITRNGDYSLDTQAGQGQILANRFAAETPYYTTALSAALTGQGQKLSALGSAAGLVSPQQVSPGNFYVNPLTGKDVSGGAIDPFTGGQRLAQVSQGQNYQQGQGTIAGARGVVTQFNQLLAQHPEFQTNPLNLSNLITNAIQNNYSNPDFPQIQASFNNAVAQYRQILGDTTVNSLLSTAKNTSLSQFLSSLDAQAQAVNQGQFQAGRGGGVGLAPTPYTAPPAQAGASNGSTFNGITLPH